MTVTAELADPAYRAYLLLRNAFTMALSLAPAFVPRRVACWIAGSLGRLASGIHRWHEQHA